MLSVASSTQRVARQAMPRTKICGVTTADDAVAALDLGADLLGLNFYPPSPRYLAPERAGELVDAVRRRRPDSEVLWTGVFVDAPAPRLAEIAAIARLDLVQLHGDEEPSHFDGHPDTHSDVGRGLAAKTIKVFRVRGAVDAEDMQRKMEPWRALGVWGFLVDTRHPELYGGTGESWDMTSIADLAADLATGGTRLLLAGGLGPDTVRAALGACRPWGVDLCSGVESEPGRKDPNLMRRLFEEIRHGTTRPAT